MLLGPAAAHPQAQASHCVQSCYLNAHPAALPLHLEITTDGKYHRLDRFGHKLPTIVVPLAAEAEGAGPSSNSSAAGGSLAEAVAAPELAASPSADGGSEMEYMNNKVGWEPEKDDIGPLLAGLAELVCLNQQRTTRCS